MDGFERGRNLEKVGQHAQDTAELFFEDVHVPVENRLGEEGQGFRYMTANLAQERLSIGLSALAAARGALDATLEYVKQRTAFGQAIGSFQSSRFALAEMATEIEIATAFCDQAVLALNRGELSPVRRGDGQVVGHRAAGAGDRPLRAAARRLRLHAGVPDRPRLRRCPRHPDLRRHHRDHEGDHRARPRRVRPAAPVSPHATPDPPRRGRRPRTYAAVLEATAKLLQTTALADLSVAQILAAADVGRTSFYEHFSSKDDVVVKLMDSLSDEVADGADADVRARRAHPG